MTHLSEERDIPVDADALWRIVSDTMQWPHFYATPNERLYLRSVEYLDETETDGPGARRRLHFLGVPAWDEQCSAWREKEYVAWLGVRNPGMRYWQQQMEIIPGDGFTTLRWDVYYELAAHPLKKAFKRTMEGIMLSSLERVEKLAVLQAKR